MMFIDTSALVAILTLEEEAKRMTDAILRSENRFTSGIVRLETAMVLTRNFDSDVLNNLAEVKRFLHHAKVETLDITTEISDIAIEGFSKFGKGRGQGAGLNLADCMTYAVAKYHRLPILFKGNDFGKTDALVVELG